MDFPSHGSQLSLALFLSKSVKHGREACVLAPVIVIVILRLKLIFS